MKCYLSTRQRNVKDLEFEVDNRTVKDAFDNISKFRYIPFFLRLGGGGRCKFLSRIIVSYYVYEKKRG